MTNLQTRLSSNSANLCNELCDICNGKLVSEWRKVPRSWKEKLVWVFTTLEKLKSNTWLHLKQDIVPFIEIHWFILWPSEKRPSRRSWKLTLYDALCHNKRVFESSQSVLRTKGFWRLKKHGQPLGETPRVSEVEEEDFFSSSDKESETNNINVSDSSLIILPHEEEMQHVVPFVQIPFNFQLTKEISSKPVDLTLSKDFSIFLKRNNLI